MIGRKIVAAILIAGFALVSGPITGSASAEPRGWGGRGRGWGSARGRGRGWGQHRNRRWYNNRWWDDEGPGRAESFWGGVIGGVIGGILRPNDDREDEGVGPYKPD